MFFQNSFKNKTSIDLYTVIGVSSLAVLALWKYIDITSQIIQKKQTIRLVKFKAFTKVQDINQLKIGQTVLIQGAVDTKDRGPITKLINNRKTYLGLNLRYKQPIYSNQAYQVKNEGYHLRLKQVLAGSCLLQVHEHFCLRSTDKNVSVPIRSLDKVDLSNALDLLHWENKLRRLTLLEYLFVFIGSVLGKVSSVFALKTPEHEPIKGIDIGYRQIDAGIQIGASLTVLGTVGLSTDGTIFIQPSFVFRDCFSFLIGLSQRLEQLSLKKNAWIGLLFVSFAYLGWRYYKYGKKNRLF